MRIIDETGVPADEREHYAARPTVEAVRCDDGVTFAFPGLNSEEFPGAQVVVIDGDSYTPIAADVFDALYAPAPAAVPVSAAQAAAAGDNPPPTTTTAATDNAPTVAGDNPPPEAGHETVITGDGNLADATTTTTDATTTTGTTATDEAEGDGGTPSVTGQS